MKYPKLRELKEAVISFFSPAATTKYPFGPAKIHPRFKGKPQPQDTCIGCGGCVQWCPAGAIKEINETQKALFIKKIEDALWITKDKTIGVLG
ncbi:4Fe-4S dicluster domain-containing protein, partial [bacterium]|nr:4Fe-4S dicluster domain-containing protein [bacterium]